jgi:hypothetical protein
MNCIAATSPISFCFLPCFLAVESSFNIPEIYSFHTACGCSSARTHLPVHDSLGCVHFQSKCRFTFSLTVFRIISDYLYYMNTYLFSRTFLWRGWLISV